jgi:PAS domain S-box-containing protein
MPTRILIIDDDKNDFILLNDFIRSIPGNSFEIDWSYKYEEALNHMCNSTYDLYFVDYFLGMKTGLELFEEAITKDFASPVILLTGVNNYSVDVKAMKTGVVDYLVKSDLTTEKLERSIRYSLERSASLKALRSKERKFHSIFEKSKDAIFLADEDLFFKEVNNAASDLFKYTKEELLQLSVYSLFIDENATDRLYTKLKTDGVAESFETELETKDRDRKNFILSISKETGPEGDFYYQGIIRDITNFKKMEKANRQIEKLRSTAMLLRTLTHEIRNPLTNINLSLDHLKTELQSDNAIVDIIERNLNRINSMVTELLNSARPGEIALQHTSLQSILDDAAEAATDRISLKQVRLIKKYFKDTACVMADPGKLKIAFLNIIINAVEAMQEGKGILNISIERKRNSYDVKIEDNGSGISEENLSKIFEPYFTSKSNGFGLGLASTLTILQSHRAVVDVQSQVGAGTSFHISFPKIETMRG